MAKSGFVPAWMKIPSADKTTGNQKFILDRSETSSTSSSPPIITGRQRHHSSDIFDHTTTRHSPFYYYKPLAISNGSDSLGRNKSNEPSFFNDNDGLFPTQSRRSYSRERSSKPSEVNGNGYRSNHNSQRRLHSVSSYPHDQQLTNPDIDSRGFDQDFPSLNGREKKESSSRDSSLSVWNNAATKLRSVHHEPFQLLDRSLSNHSRTFPSTRILTRQDRLLSTPNGLNGSSITRELHTNCKTQTKNLDKRSDFFNSLKNDSTNEGNKRSSTKMTSHSDANYQPTKGTLLLLSVPETPEEKEFLIQMGWKDCDEITYEITDKDKEEYEKRIQRLPKTDHTSAALMSALHRRTLPCLNIRDLELNGSASDDDESSDE